MKQLVLTLLLALTAHSAWAADLINGVEYYLINDFYGKLLGQSEDGKAPALSAEGKVSDANSYVFVAETSGTSGYVYLKQKSSGRYLAATNASGNTWGVVFESAKVANDRFLWQVTTGIKTRITNKKNTSARLGCDWNNTTFESVYYNKGAGVMNFWSVIPVTSNPNYDYTNVRGTAERDVYILGSQNVTLDKAIDLHIYREATPITTGSVNITNPNAWVIFDNCTPTNVKNNYLSKIKVNGETAVLDKNVRIAIYLNGAAVIPCTTDETALVGYTANNYGGTDINLANGNHNDLGKDKNAIRSFKLKRGYMATLATSKDGRGYSRVYVADHADLNVSTLPEALNGRISSIHIKRWQYTSKKGFGGSSDKAYKLRCGWSYNWDANSTSSIDVEYIPIHQHRYWPSLSNVNGKEASTALLGLNEPEHPEQHDKCSCGGTVSAWTATTMLPDYLPAGSRIGSPSPTDQSWLKEYFGHVQDMAYRCDFAVTHGYWGPSVANGTSGWNNRINSIYNDTKRPLWITEWEYGSSWDPDKGTIYNGTVTDMAKKTLEILDALETNEHLERYAYYNTDGIWKLHCWYDEGGITPVGEAYTYVKSDFAYKASQQVAPNYWTPEIKVPSVEDVKLANGLYIISVKNPNGDFTKSMLIEAKDKSGVWHKALDVLDRSLYDNESNNFLIKMDNPQNYNAWRVTIVAQDSKNTEKVSAVKSATPQNQELNVSSSMFDEAPFVDKGVATYAKDIKGDLGYSGMQPVAGWAIEQNGDARAAGVYSWGSQHAIGGADYKMPAKNSEGTTAGGGLAVVAVWTADLKYTKDYILMPGKYTITIPVYNIGAGTDIAANNLGIALSGGNKYMSTKKKYNKGEWTTEKFEFDIKEPQFATISLGYKANDASSGSCPHLVYDYVKIDYTPWVETSIDIKAGVNFATLMVPFEAELPAGVEAYTVSSISDGYIYLSSASAINANTPYILYSEDAVSKSLSGYNTAAEDSYTQNGLTGIYTAIDAPANSYILATHDGVTAFYSAAYVKSGKLAPYKAYVTYAGSSAQLRISMGEDNPTAIEAVEADTETDAVYNVAGQRVNTNYRGLVIKNGKKAIKIQ